MMKKNKILRQIEIYFKKLNNLIKKNVYIKYLSIFSLTVGLMFMVYFTENAGIWFKASILEAPQSFNGTVMPLYKVASWEYWSSAKNLNYNQIDSKYLIDLPPYDLSKMQFPDSQLVWGDRSQDLIRNTKIVYPVVYLGDYKLDHKENAGSHLAVDIKTPIGTPIHAIANGRVVKTSMQESGFGHHVVIEHKNVPDPDNKSKLITIYSSYSHMSNISVSEGQNVLKGDLIGSTGMTGTATTPHVHFQIDRSNISWHPYWPFTSADSRAAGLSFFDSVNNGLGMDNARKYTINPMKFVEDNMSYSQVVSANDIGISNSVTNDVDDNVDKDVDDNVEIVDNPFNQVEDNSQAQDTNENIVKEETNNNFNENDTKLFSYTISGENISLINNGVALYIEDKDKQIDQLDDDDIIRVDISGVGRLNKKSFTKSDFNKHILKVFVNSSDVGQANILIGRSSYQINFIDSVKGIAKLAIDTDGFYQKSIFENIKIVALDEDGNLTPSVSFSGAINIKAIDGMATFSPEILYASDFKGGVANVKMLVKNTDPVVIRAQNGALIGESKAIKMEEKILFNDINYKHRNYEAIKYLKDHDIISGYNDGNFKPNQTVNRVEALKMLMLAFNVNSASKSNLNFTDVDNNAWYADTLSKAVSRGIVKGYSDGSFKPDSNINRAEYLKILFATNNMKTDGEIANPYKDVDINSWFAPYSFLANQINVFNTGSYFNPDKPMTRAELAETIYRLKMIQDRNILVYSK